MRVTAPDPKSSHFPIREPQQIDTCSETESPSTKHLPGSNMKEWGAKISARPSAQTISGPIENSIRKADGLLRSSEQEGEAVKNPL
ncbi:hypothetical protein CEXT_639061 [Caerostris extrusa]|uniref:Uncharacterized protein n=1 Tax=Caerostris extrusa TaxID=172846 RepID=A0AAV4WPZ4_CAEEX|nr:hypothetical protein CEXT_639061 [Caerostris extrusa]